MDTAFNQYMDTYFKKHDKNPSLEIKYLYVNGLERIVLEEAFPSIQDDIIVTLHPYAANRKLETHKHDYFELMYVSRGYCHQTVDGIHIDLHEGDICLLNPSHAHKVATATPEDLMFNIIIRPSLFKSSFMSLMYNNNIITHFFYASLFHITCKNSPLFFHNTEGSNTRDLIQHLILEFYEKKVGYRKNMECYLALLLTSFMRNNASEMDKSIQLGNSLTEIMSYIGNHIHEVTLKELAAHFHYHPNYLSNLIREYTGNTFSSLVQKARMDEVCMYLKKTDLSVDEICRICGYHDRSSFNRQFKKNFNLSPSEFRALFK